MRYRTLEEELQAETVRSSALRQALAAEDTTANASLYLLLRAVDRFQGTYHRFPGTFDGYGPSELLFSQDGIAAEQRGILDPHALMWFVLARSIELSYALHCWCAACSELEEDVALLKATVASVTSDSGVGTAAVSDDLIEEMVRFGASELHVIGAIMGGIAAQEVIKFITRQFVPVGGTLIYNAMASTTSVLRI